MPRCGWREPHELALGIVRVVTVAVLKYSGLASDSSAEGRRDCSGTADWRAYRQNQGRRLRSSKASTRRRLYFEHARQSAGQVKVNAMRDRALEALGGGSARVFARSRSSLWPSAHAGQPSDGRSGTLTFQRPRCDGRWRSPVKFGGAPGRGLSIQGECRRNPSGRAAHTMARQHAEWTFGDRERWLSMQAR